MPLLLSHFSPEPTIDLWIRRFVFDEFTDGLKSSLRGNSGNPAALTIPQARAWARFSRFVYLTQSDTDTGKIVA
jgi:hypothetical protein